MVFRSSKGEDLAGGVEVVFHEKIGAHDITVVRATDAVELVDWIDDFLQVNGVNETVSFRTIVGICLNSNWPLAYSFYYIPAVTVGHGAPDRLVFSTHKNHGSGCRLILRVDY